MYQTQLKDGNVVISELPYELIKNNIQFHRATNCTIFLAPNANLAEGMIHVYGDNAAVFIGNTNLRRAAIHAHAQSCVYIGNRVYMNGHGEPQSIRATGTAHVIIGNHCLCSMGINITTTDTHLIYDRASRRRVNKEKSIFIGDHVWLGREVKVYKKARISSGCMCAAGGIVSGGLYPANSLLAGLPARIKKEGSIFWLSPCSYDLNEAELGHYTALDEADAEYRNACFEPTQGEMLHPADLDAALRTLSHSRDKVAFLYDKLWYNNAHNRFAWEDNTESTGGSIPACDDAFSRLKLTHTQHTKDTTAACEASQLQPEDMAALLCAGSIRWKCFYYGLLSIFSLGAKRRYYRARKREMNKWRARIATIQAAFQAKLSGES